jgi:hypothetical protein
MRTQTLAVLISMLLTGCMATARNSAAESMMSSRQIHSAPAEATDDVLYEPGRPPSLIPATTVNLSDPDRIASRGMSTGTKVAIVAGGLAITAATVALVAGLVSGLANAREPLFCMMCNMRWY